MKRITCDICGRHAALSAAHRFPALHICHECVAHFQRGVVGMMGEEALDALPDSFLEYATDGHWLVSFNTARFVGFSKAESNVNA